MFGRDGILNNLPLFGLIYTRRKSKWRDNYDLSKFLKKVRINLLILIFLFTNIVLTFYLIIIKIFPFLSFAWFNQIRGNYHNFIYFLFPNLYYPNNDSMLTISSLSSLLIHFLSLPFYYEYNLNTLLSLQIKHTISIKIESRLNQRNLKYKKLKQEI